MKSNFGLNFTIIFTGLCIGLVTWLSLSNVDKTAQNQVANSLRVTLNANYKAFDTWSKENQESVQIWANTEVVTKAAQGLITAEQNFQGILTNPNQQIMRDLFKIITAVKGYQGFFIIDKNNLNLSSSRDENLNQTNISLSQPGFFEKIWRGQTAVSHPLVSEVMLYNSDDIQMTMFVGAPIQDEKGQIIAALTFRIDPEIAFSNNLQKVQGSRSGKTYSFNNKGNIIQEQRFNTPRFQLPFDPDLNLLINETSITYPEILAIIPSENSAAVNVGEEIINVEGYQDYRGVEVVGAWLWDHNLNLGFVTEIDKNEAFEIYQPTKFTLIVFAVFSVILLLLISFTFFINQNKALKNKFFMDSLSESLPGLLFQYRISFDEISSLDFFGNKDKTFFNFKNEKETLILRKLIHQDDFSIFNKALKTSQNNLSPINCDVRVSSNSPEVSWVRIIATPIKEQNGDTVWTGVWIDISEQINAVENLIDLKAASKQNIEKQTAELRQEIEERTLAEKEALLAKEEVLNANRVKSQFLANMSHELRIPLNSIIGFSELNKNPPKGKAKQKNYYPDINQSGQELLKLINDMVDYAKYEAGEMKLDEKKLDIRNILNNCFKDVENKAIKAGILLSVKIEDPLPEIIADEEKISKVLTTLVLTAIKFTKAKGTIIIGVHKNSKGKFEFYVEDNGIGFRKKDIPKFLSPYGQVEGILERQQTGTGLSYPLARAYAEIHGGEFILESLPGKGTKCRFILPQNRLK